MADLHTHTLTVRNHRVTCDSPVLVQHGMGHDAVALDLDAEWDGLSVRLVLGPCGSAYDVLYEGGPVVIPAATLAEAGWLPVSVVGYGDDGAVRVTTARCDHLLRVVESGCTDGSLPPEDAPDLLGQLVEAAERADASADAADKAAASAASAASAATEAAGKVDAAVESATKATKAATDAATAATDAAKSATDAARRAEKLAEDIPAYVTTAKQAATEAEQAASEADGSATAAGKSASAAAGSAEQAAGSAGAAQGSADAASGSAQQAATSAGEAASSATAASESAEAAQGHATDAAQSAAEAESWAGAAQVSAGNVLTGTASGKVAHADDAYAAKPREVRIEGRTVQNLWPVIDAAHNGVTVSTDGTGLISMSGTSAGGSTMGGSELPLVAGKQYTLLVSNKAAGVRLLVNRVVGGELDGRLIDVDLSTTTTTTTVPADDAVYTAYLFVADGTAVSASFRVMLVEGGTAPDCFTPTGMHGVEPEGLMVAGKNLNDVAQQIDDVAWSYTHTGWNEIESGFLDLFNSLPQGQYTLRLKCRIESVSPSSAADPAANNVAGVIVRSSADVMSPCTMYVKVGVTQVGQTIEIVQPVEVSEETHMGQYDELYVYSPGVDNGYRSISTFYDVQLEYGSTATAYEPPDVTEVELPETDPLMDGDALTIAQDGAVSVDRSDGTTSKLGTVQTPQLPAPTFNAYPTGGYVPGDTAVGYERDVNIAYAELEAKIAALTVAQATS